MIRVDIKPEEVSLAKELSKKFDEQKTYDKFKCETNFIGILGEIVFHRWLNENGFSHKWIDFVKQGYDQPDFIIVNYNIDLKTTSSQKMWIQKAVFDYYVFARVNADMKELFLISTINKTRLERLIKEGQLEIVQRGERFDYLVSIDQMKDFEEFKTEMKTWK